MASASGTPSSGAIAIHAGPRFSVNISSTTLPTAPMIPPSEPILAAIARAIPSSSRNSTPKLDLR